MSNKSKGNKVKEEVKERDAGSSENVSPHIGRGKVEDLKKAQSENSEILKEVVNKGGQVKKSPQEELNEVLKTNNEKLVEQVNALSGRIMGLEISLAATSKALDAKDVVSQEEINKAIEEEQKRVQVFQQIQQITGNYRVRLEMCKKWNIEVENTPVIAQLKVDSTVSEKEKLEIAAEHGIDVRLFLTQDN